MGNEDQALTTHTNNHKREHYHHKKGKHITRIKKIIIEDIAEIYPKSNAIHMTRKDTLPESVLETKVALTS